MSNGVLAWSGRIGLYLVAVTLVGGGMGCTRHVETKSSDEKTQKSNSPEEETETESVDDQSGSTSGNSAPSGSSGSGSGSQGTPTQPGEVEKENGEPTQPEEEKQNPDDSSSTQEQSDSTTTSDPGECRDKEERACDELPNGTKVEFPGGTPQGECARGVSTCVDGQWGKCIGTVGPKAKDTCEPGNDANCNGKPTDHCDCEAGEKAPCGKDEGACEKGEMTCGSDGSWGECIGAKNPTPEVCDGLGVDEDCNGKADLADPKCECVGQSKRACRLQGLGDCAQGAQICNDGKWGSCDARFRKSLERCGKQSDGQEKELGQASGDEDCDGRVDESDFSNPRPAGCKSAFLDKDRDGYGAMGPSLSEDAQNATHGCLCQTAPLPRNWRWDSGRRANTDCGDCLVEGNLVNPGTRRKFEQPSRCLRQLNHPLEYDYNCDGQETRGFTEAFRCETKASGGGCRSFGQWVGQTPGCGDSGLNYTINECIYDEDANTCRISMMNPSSDRNQICG